jgi:hypothetical protein
MSKTTIISNIDRSTEYPIKILMSAQYKCGTIILSSNAVWTEQMIAELPAINIRILTLDNKLYQRFSLDINISDIVREDGTIRSELFKIYNAPESFYFIITPIFDNNAIAAHNNTEENGIVDNIKTVNGIVTTDIMDIWTTPTNTFNISLEFDDTNIVPAGGSSPVLIEKSITENGTYIASSEGANGYSQVVVDVPPTGAVENDVTFYDYDGTVLYSYSAEDFAKLDSLPANPTHEGLTAQGWNWSLSDAKTYVANNIKLNIGQMYTPIDGKSKIHISLPEGRTEPTICLNISANGSAIVNYGDGTPNVTLTNTGSYAANIYDTHSYPSSGDYDITFWTETNKKLTISGDSTSSYLLSDSDQDTTRVSYTAYIQNVAIGNNTLINKYAFRSLVRMNYIILPFDATAFTDNLCQNSYSLISASIPNSVTSIGTYSFYCCRSLESVTFPNSVESIGSYSFNGCYCMKTVTLPSKIKIISDYMFNYCASLKYVVIPEGVTTIGTYAFNFCESLPEIRLPSTLTSIGSYAFNTCTSLVSIVIPNGVKSIENSTFYYCTSLAYVDIPDSVTSIGTSAFYYCTSISSITLPSGVTSIGHSAFNNCRNLKYFRFERSTPVTLANNNKPFTYWDSTKTKIFCPAEGLAAYKSASNYPDPSTFKYIGFATYEAGVELPTTTQDESYTYTWYATVDDWLNNTNPITVGNGNEVYANITAV